MSPRWVLRCLAAAVLGAALLVSASPLRGQEALRDSTALSWIPADAAFYRSQLRNGEQFRVLARSNAVRKIQENPFVAMGLAMLRAQWEEPQDENLRQLKAWYQEPQNQELVSFLLDVFSQEVFVYGDESFGRMLGLVNRINRANTQAQIAAIRAGQPLDDGQSKAAIEATVKLLLENPEQFQVPDLVLGFKIDNADRATHQLDRLEDLLRKQLEGRPELTERLTHEDIAGARFLTWRLDGSLIPWEQWERENRENQEIDPETMKNVIDVFKAKKLTLSVGVRENYLLVSVGDTNEHLENLGQGPLLIEREELAPLRKFADKRITSIGYVSQDFRQQAVASNRQQIEGFFTTIEALVKNPGAGGGQIELDEETRRELTEDLQKLSDQLTAAIPKQGAALNFSFLTPQGYEGYGYDWSETPGLDATQPLTVLSHLGGSPLAYFAFRTRYSPESYEAGVHWIKRAFYYFEKTALKEMDEESRDKYEEFRGQAIPLLARLDLANRELLIPAFRDGQGAIVLDAQTKSKAWHAQMPPAQEPLPILELGFIWGVSDAAALKQAVVEYLSVARDIWKKARAADEDLAKLPDFDVVYPQQREVDGGELYYYPLPEAWGLDKKLAPNAALSENFLALTYTPKFSERLLSEKPLKKGALPVDPNQPLGAAAALDFAGLIDAIGPWVHYGIDLQSQMQEAKTAADDDQDQPEAPKPDTQVVKQQVQFVLDVLKCYRGFSSVAYREGEALVTRYQSRYKDLPE